MVYRQRKMEQEYAWRREVLDKTGIVLLDRKSLAISGNDGKIAPRGSGPEQQGAGRNQPGPAAVRQSAIAG